MKQNRREDYTIESGPMGPIGESEALIIRANRNCGWNRCLFCPAYKGLTFSRRSVNEIKHDIDVVRRIADMLNEASFHLGLSGSMYREVFVNIIRDHPEIYETAFPPTGEAKEALCTLNNVANWMIHGSRRVFLQDANAFQMKSDEMAECIRYLKESLPTVETVSCYARSRTCAKKRSDELTDLKDAGLSWCYVGVESGSDEVLSFVKKGVTGGEHVDGARKVIEAGIGYAAFIMPGLGGADGSEKHMVKTVEVLNHMQPHEIRVRSLAVMEGTPLYKCFRSGEFVPASEDQMIDEIRILLEEINFDTVIETYQMTNVLFNVKGNLGELREELLGTISQYKSLVPRERAERRLKRYLSGGYLDFVKRCGRYDEQLEELIGSALHALRSETDSLESVEEAILAIKSRVIP